MQEKTIESEDKEVKYARLKAEYDNYRVKCEKEQELLKIRLTSFEIDRQNEIANIKQRFEFFNNTNTENLKNNHFNY